MLQEPGGNWRWRAVLRQPCGCQTALEVLTALALAVAAMVVALAPIFAVLHCYVTLLG